MTQSLSLVFPAHGEKNETVGVCYILSGDALIANFEVTTQVVNPERVDDLEIYNGNVVELFVCPGARAGQTPRPYFEFEVSRYNQGLTVQIDERGRFNDKWKTSQFRHSITVRPSRPGWDAVMEVPLKELGWGGAPATLIGNAFAILGHKGARRFYSAYLPPQPKPNFHLPDFFRPFPLPGTAPREKLPRT